MEYRFMYFPLHLKHAFLGGIQNMEGDYQLEKGISLIENFPDDAFFKMDKKWGKVLPDFVNGLDSFPIVSEKVKNILMQYPHDKIEFLPIEIHNHKDRVEKNPYWLLNLLDSQDCLDEALSKPIVNNILPDEFRMVEKLAIRPEAIHPDAVMFRIHRLKMVKLLREDVALHLEREGCTGIELRKLEDVIPLEDIR